MCTALFCACSACILEHTDSVRSSCTVAFWINVVGCCSSCLLLSMTITSNKCDVVKKTDYVKTTSITLSTISSKYSVSEMISLNQLSVSVSLDNLEQVKAEFVHFMNEIACIACIEVTQCKLTYTFFLRELFYTMLLQ